MLLGGIMESISVSLIMPLVTAIMNVDSWNETWYAQIICNYTGINNQRSYIIFLIIGLIIVFLLKGIYLALEYYIQYSFSTKCRYNMQYKLLCDYLHKPYSYFLHSNTGEIVRIINADTVQAYSILEGMLNFFTESIVCLAISIAIFIMSPNIALGIFLILLLEIFLIAKILRPKMLRLGKIQREESAIAYQWMLQALDGIKTVRVNGNEQYFLKKYSDHFSKANNINRVYNTLNNMPRLIIESFTTCSVLMAMMLMILNDVDMITLIPVLSAFILAAMRLLPSTNRISTIINQLPFLIGGLDNVIRIIHENEQLIDEKHSFSATNNAKKIPAITFNRELCLHNVSFSYPDSDKLILDKVTFFIKPRQSIGLVGASGGGKTTTVDIILGLLYPNSGQVLVDGVDINKNLKNWLTHVAYIPQQIFLIDATIRENIALGIDDAAINLDKIYTVIREAQLEELVASLPDGINTSIGEQGVRLSGGQRQRIGIARALYSDAEILFFDEATSALDNETEQAIMESIEKLKNKKTLIIIAHRLSTIRKCDVVYRVENGKIFEVENA